MRLAGERHRDDLNRISARHPGYRVHFPKNIAQFANARPDMGCEWGDPVYWLTRAGDEVGPGRRRWLELLRPTGGGLETVEQREAIAMALSAEATRLRAAHATRRHGGRGDDGHGGDGVDGVDGDFIQDSFLAGSDDDDDSGVDAFDGGMSD